MKPAVVGDVIAEKSDALARCTPGTRLRRPDGHVVSVTEAGPAFHGGALLVGTGPDADCWPATVESIAAPLGLSAPGGGDGGGDALMLLGLAAIATVIIWGGRR